MNKGRVCILMMDSLGIGASKDAIHYGDEKANTLGHILMRYPDLKIPNLTRWGLLHALEASSGMPAPNSQPICAYGYGVEQSKGKDTLFSRASHPSFFKKDWAEANSWELSCLRHNYY
jgi:phosphopentomutase